MILFDHHIQAAAASATTTMKVFKSFWVNGKNKDRNELSSLRWSPGFVIIRLIGADCRVVEFEELCWGEQPSRKVSRRRAVEHWEDTRKPGHKIGRGRRGTWLICSDLHVIA